jgi:hypothetical protein
VILSAVTVFVLVGVSFLERMFLGLRKGVYRRLKKGELPRDGEG